MAALLLAATVALGACAGAPDDEPGTPHPDQTLSPPATDGPATERKPTPDPDPDPDAAELPGDVIDFGPGEGAELAVVGVAADDMLNVRSGPGVEFAVVSELAPLADGVPATGHNRQLDDGVWVELTTDGVTGWANLAYLAYLGQVNDVTSQLSVTPVGTDMVALAEEVAQQRMHAEEDTLSVVVVDGPHSGDLVEITVDVLGLLDDSVLGERLHIFAMEDGGRYAVRTVEATTLCARGVTDGLCL